MRTFLPLLLLLAGCLSERIPPPAVPRLTVQSSGTDALLIGLHALDARVAWASGTGGHFLRTIDGGESWTQGIVPGADSLQFRDVHAFSADVAYLLSIGPGSASRIYKTVDGGRNWQLQFENRDPQAFFDCFDFWDERSGIALSDEVDGRIPIARTGDGRTWTVLPAENSPQALEGEGGFAASGTCIRTFGGDIALIGTGNTTAARVHRTTDKGETWTATTTGIPAGDAAGIASLAFRDDKHGAALGGNLVDPDAVVQNVAITDDGGRTWRPGGSPTFAGAVYGAEYAGRVLAAVGPGGASFSADDGLTWSVLDSTGYWSVDFGSESVGWAVGPRGRITKISFEE